MSPRKRHHGKRSQKGVYLCDRDPRVADFGEALGRRSFSGRLPLGSLRRRASLCQPRTRRESGSARVRSSVESENRRFETVWNAFLSVVAAMGLVWWRWGSPQLNHTNLSVRRVRAWMEQTWSGSGSGYLISTLKRIAQEARLSSVSAEPAGDLLRGFLRKLPTVFQSRKGLEQLSFLARALPEGDARVVTRALNKHRALSQTPFTTDPDTLADARSFAKKFASRYMCGDPANTTLPYSGGGVFTRPRSKGGLRESIRQSKFSTLQVLEFRIEPWMEEDPEMLVDIYEQARAMEGVEWSPVYPLLDPQPIRVWDEFFIDMVSGPPAVYWQAAKAVRDLGRLPMHRVCALSERGFKARIVSSPETNVALAGMALNRAMLGALRKHPNAADFLRGDRHLAIMRSCRNTGTIVSTDLTAASDMLPLDLVESVVSGVIEGWNDLPPEWADALRVLSGPQHLVYPNGEEVDSERGILMGLGPTWPLLSIIHLFWVHKAMKAAPPRDRDYGSFAVGGDDLIGFWPDEVVSSYHRWVTRCGGQFSAGKYFLSQTAGNFTEITFYRAVGRKVPIRFGLGLPVRGFVGRPPVKMGLSYESLGENHGQLIRARRVLRAVYPEVWGLFHKHGIPPNLPSPLGGGGLPPVRGSVARISCARRFRLALGRFLYGTPDSVHLVAPPSGSDGGDPILEKAFRQSVRTIGEWVQTGRVKLTRDDHLVCDVIRKLIIYHTSRLLYLSDKQLTPASPDPVGLTCRSGMVHRWVARQLEGGVPNRVAIKDAANSRFALLTRLAWCRRVSLSYDSG